MTTMRRYMTRDEIAAQISAERDVGVDQVYEVLEGLAGMGVPVDAVEIGYAAPQAIGGPVSGQPLVVGEGGCALYLPHSGAPPDGGL